MKWNADEQVAKGNAEQQRRYRASDEQRPIAGRTPAGVGKFAAKCESHRPYDEADQNQEHRQIQ